MNGKNILHYTVGLNKNRGGGLTKYVDDLSKYQSQKNNVFILYPGELKILNKKTYIKKEKGIGKIHVFSIVNPLKLPMLFGLRDYDYLYKKTKKEIWIDFLKNNSIDIIHMHTIMGIYEEFVDAANELNIPIIYTTHDYFGICPKQILFFNNNICKNWKSCIDCPTCNLTSLSKLKSLIIHSKIFTYIRKYKFFQILKSKEKSKIDTDIENGKKMDVKYYINLRRKMIGIFKKMDFFHFNSSVSRNVFIKCIPSLNGKIINITHNDIKDFRKVKDYNNEILRITYLGPANNYKGFDNLITTMDKIFQKNKNFSLNIYTCCEIKRPYLYKKGNSYKYSDLKKIFDETDLLIAPSNCLETFGFTIEEALSFGVPVFVSDRVGAKDLIKNDFNGYVFKNNQLERLILKVYNDRNILSTMNLNICNDNFYSFEQHCNDIYDLYENILNLKRRKGK